MKTLYTIVVVIKKAELVVLSVVLDVCNYGGEQAVVVFNVLVNRIISYDTAICEYLQINFAKFAAFVCLALCLMMSVDNLMIAAH